MSAGAHSGTAQAVNVEAAMEIMQVLAIVLIPEDVPLGKDVRGVGVADVVGHGPGQKLSLGVECDGTGGDGGGIHDGGDSEFLLAGRLDRDQQGEAEA